MKFLSLSMISWSYLHLFKNHMISCIHLPSSSQQQPINIKLIDSNGVVKIYDHPIQVSEVLLEFPKHLVCHSDSFYIGQKIPPLSENDKLQMGHKYFLLPKHFFQSVLSFVTIASFFASSSQHKQKKDQHPMFLNPSLTNAKNNSFFDIQKTTSGCLRIRVSDEFISRLLDQTNNNNNNKKMMMIESESSSSSSSRSKICNTPQLLKDYTQLVRRRNWKPKLETIKEKSQRRKLSSFGIRRKNKLIKKKTNNSKPIIIAGGGSSVSKYHRLALSSLKFPSKKNILVKSNRGSH